VPRRPAAEPSSGFSTARKTGLPRSSAAFTTRAPAAPSPITRTASMAGHWASSGALRGPAGRGRPLPTPAHPSTTAIARSLTREGFCNPSSMTMTSAPSASAMAAPAGRSRETMVGA
jgi:hypothetical protein